MTTKPKGAYGAEHGIVDYILGITFEIWEQRGIELIEQYYADDITVYSMGGIVKGANGMIDGTRAMLEAFPDRLLLADDVIWSGSREEGYYTSHRIVSPMTNTGPSAFGPATGRAVRILTVADCVIEDGVITREWLVRDNHALLRQLGFDAVAQARQLAASFDAASRDWMQSEIARIKARGLMSAAPLLPTPDEDPQLFAECVLASHWTPADRELLHAAYAPYAILHRSPIEWYSGREAIVDHFARLCSALSVSGISVDHIAVQPADSESIHIAVRWTLSATHSGDYLGVAASGRDVFVLGVTHWRIVDDRIAMEWTIFDGLGVMAQLV